MQITYERLKTKISRYEKYKINSQLCINTSC